MLAFPNLVVMAYSNGHLYAFNGNNMMWEHECKSYVRITPINEDVIAFHCLGDGAIVGVDVRSGVERWHITNHTQYEVVVPSVEVLLVASHAILRAVNIANGHEKWSLDLAHSIHQLAGTSVLASAVDEQSVVYLIVRFGVGEKLHCKLLVLNPHVGEVITSADAAQAIHCFVSALGEGKVVASYDNALVIYRYNDATGKLMIKQFVKVPKADSYISQPPAVYPPKGTILLVDNACNVYLLGKEGKVESILRKPKALGSRLGCEGSLVVAKDSVLVQYRYDLPPTMLLSLDMFTKQVLWSLQLTSLYYANAFFGCDEEWFVTGTAVPPEASDLAVHVYQAVQAHVQSVHPVFLARGLATRVVVTLTANLAFHDDIQVYCLEQDSGLLLDTRFHGRMITSDQFECSVPALRDDINLTLAIDWPDSSQLRLPAGPLKVYGTSDLRPDNGHSESWTKIQIHGDGFGPCQFRLPCYCLLTVDGATTIQGTQHMNDSVLLCAIPPHYKNSSTWTVAVQVAVGHRDLRTVPPLLFTYHSETPFHTSIMFVILVGVPVILIAVGISHCVERYVHKDGQLEEMEHKAEYAALWDGVYVSDRPPARSTSPIRISFTSSYLDG